MCVCVRVCVCASTFLVTRTTANTATGSNKVRESETGNWEMGGEGREGRGGGKRG